MSAALTESPAASTTLWGLEPHQLHDRYWAAHGVQVVRLSQPSELVPRAELFLLTDPRSLVLFPLHAPIDDLNWIKPHVLYLSIKDRRDRTYREFVLVDPPDADVGSFLGFHRAYDGQDHHLGRVLLTTDPEVARFWQRADSVSTASRALRRAIHPLDRAVRSVEGSVFDATSDTERHAFLRKLQLTWRTPDVTIPRARKLRDGVFAHHAQSSPASTTPEPFAPPPITVPPVWLGAGRSISDSSPLVGPLVVFDDPAARPPPPDINWHDLTTVPNQFPEAPDPLDPARRKRTPRPFFNLAKRLFDIAFSLIALLFTLPLYPFILLAIYLEDGRPFFFVHKRETLYGRTFGCIKFRSMRKDAERLKRELAAKNQADGPQFFIEKDPRLTRTGAFLRRYNLDELPQFLNVLLGDMSVVGPRPSPFSENQYCPPWREARLSVRPGVTGLWQVSRTRKAGSDFQEWIKYDLQYVQNATFTYDLRIIYQTIAMLFRKAGQS
jgi:lipopolysaccharide/colanic/teichoic acid biosynthesis glycosyltransferase